MKRYEVVRDDGDMSVGLGYSYAYYEYDESTGHFWQVSPHSDWRRWIGAEGEYPCEKSNIRAVKSFIETGTWESDRYWLLRVREVV